MRRQNVAAALKYLQDKADLRGRFERATSLDPQEQDLADIAVETGASFIPGVGPALAARDFERARRADDEAGMAMAAASAIPGERLAKLLGKFDPTRLELDVYHGTPHRFPATEANPLGEFDASKIGTGEGAQAYGHGIYFAESPGVAKSYQNPNAGSAFLGRRSINVGGQMYGSRKQLTDARDAAIDNTERAMFDILATAQELGIDSPQKLAKAVKANPVRFGSWDFGQETIDAAMKRIRKEASFSSQKGTFYKADLPDEMIDRMLDWDKPLSEQPAVFKELMKVTDLTGTAGFLAKSPEKTTFGELYNALKNQNSQSDVSEYFRKGGIPGIKYLDAGSRGQGGSGTRNFVVFPGEEKKVRILERDGQKAPPQKIAQALEATAQKTTAIEVPDVLHGSPMRGLTNLSPSKSMEVRGATWFSDNPDVADQYTFPREYGEILYDAEPGEVYKAGLSFKNPMTVDMEGRVGDATELSKLVKKAKEEGYDGLILRNVDDSVDSSKLLGTSYAVFDPSQIKLKKK